MWSDFQLEKRLIEEATRVQELFPASGRALCFRCLRNYLYAALLSFYSLWYTYDLVDKSVLEKFLKKMPEVRWIKLFWQTNKSFWQQASCSFPNDGLLYFPTSPHSSFLASDGAAQAAKGLSPR